MKKGLFFTVSALMLVALLLYAQPIHFAHEEQEKMVLFEVRMHNLEGIVQNINKEFGKSVDFAAARALRAALNTIAATQVPATDASARLAELVINGTYSGAARSEMSGSTLPELLNTLQSSYSALGVTMEYRIVSMSFAQATPWILQANLTLEYNISDDLETATWATTTNISRNMSLIGWEDPLFVLATDATYNHTIEIMDVDYFINTSNGDTTNLYTHITEARYINTSIGPSYLKRMEGSFAANGFGIESLVNRSQLQAAYNYTNRSVVDYLYFDSTATYKNWSVGGTHAMPSWFRIDNRSGPNNKTHTAFYNASTYLI